ncbi:ATP-binding protein [Desulfovibrio sp.]|uniref:ATP-binding protein n=1 Tax=Desulfovibrio sp. TaxID=885 RepID=UPI0025BF516F|nr:ATP-binding protein [Desulfovibrio sp.]
MRIVIASGKGGAGKTTVTACLAGQWERDLLLVDADVEAPNLHLLLHPSLAEPESVYLEVPELVEEKCTGCGACRPMCSYGAIAMMGAKPMYFQDMCHGCGGCFEVCPEQALRVAQRELGALLQGSVPAGSKTLPFLMGRTRVGEAMTPPLLRAQERKLAELLAGHPSDVLMDAPPGVSCPAMTAARGADAVLLVAEPTPFGFYDFKLAHAAFAQLGRPVAVVMNRVGMEGNADCENELRAWCAGAKLSILAELPFQREAAHAYAHGLPPTEAQGATGQEWRQRFAELAVKLREFAKGASHA